MEDNSDEQRALINVIENTPGLRLWLADGQLRYRAPSGLVNDRVIEILRANKAKIIDILQREGNLRSGITSQPEYSHREIPTSVRLRFHDSYWQRRDKFEVDYTNGPKILCQVPGLIDAKAMATLIHTIWSRHDVLRGCIKDIAGLPYLTFDPGYVPNIYVRDYELAEKLRYFANVRVTFCPGENGDIKSWASSVAWDRLDPSVEPWRVLLSNIDDENFLLGFVFHHFISDYYALPAMAGEMEELYGQQAVGAAVGDIPLPLNYCDYLLATQEWLVGPKGRANRAYWRKVLANSPGTMRHNDADAVQGDVDNDILPIHLPREGYHNLLACCASENCTVLIALLAAQYIALQKVTNSDDLTIWGLRQGRSEDSLTGVFGMLVDEIPYRVRLPANPTVQEVLRLVRDVVLEAEENLPYPSQLLKEEMIDMRASLVAPQLNFISPASESGLANRPGWRSFDVGPAPRVTQFKAEHIYPYSMRATVIDDSLRGTLMYGKDRFSKKTMEVFNSVFHEALYHFG